LTRAEEAPPSSPPRARSAEGEPLLLLNSLALDQLTALGENPAVDRYGGRSQA
jgi:hypothetical protein